MTKSPVSVEPQHVDSVVVARDVMELTGSDAVAVEHSAIASVLKEGGAEKSFGLQHDALPPMKSWRACSTTTHMHTHGLLMRAYVVMHESIKHRCACMHERVTGHVCMCTSVYGCLHDVNVKTLCMFAQNPSCLNACECKYALTWLVYA